MFVVDRPLDYTQDAKELIDLADSDLINQVVSGLQNITQFDKENIQSCLKAIADNHGMKLGELMKYVRVFIAGRSASPSVFEMIEILGKDNSIARMSR